MKRKFLPLILLFCISLSCTQSSRKEGDVAKSQKNIPVIKETSMIVLGTLQDGGSPHIGCKKDCCKDLFSHPDTNRKVVCLGIIDPQNKKNYLIEATPDLPTQMKNLQKHSSFSTKETPDGIFVSHAHIGHYTGLMYLGKEAMNANRVKVYVLPRMKEFLEKNGPWSQLVKLNNILIEPVYPDQVVHLTSNVKVTPVIVPHRDEYSETCGYLIEGPNKKVLFIPDIDKWEKWGKDIIEAISKVDYAFIDGTFYDGEEINSRNISEIPHPFIIESMNKFKSLPSTEKNKIYFIHFNHTNPVLKPGSKQTDEIIKNGFHIATINQIITL
jgi:pyrroloquinoline quinone biosynthesis protein B